MSSIATEKAFQYLQDMLLETNSESVKYLYRTISHQQETLVYQKEIISRQDELIAEIGKELHYPDRWDTTAFPTILDAVKEMAWLLENE